MKAKIMFAMAMCVCCMAVTAQTAAGDGGAQTVIDLSTFAGIVAVISSLATQVLKLIPSIGGSKAAKIGVSVTAGIAVCMLAWVLRISDPLTGLAWWQALVYGIAAGLSGCGFYDLVKVVWALFKPGK